MSTLYRDMSSQSTPYQVHDHQFKSNVCISCYGPRLADGIYALQPCARTLGCQQFITQVSKVKNVMLPGAELKDLFTRMPKWPKKSKFINLQGCLNRDLFLVLWLLSEIFVSTVFCLKITLFMYQMTFSLNIFMPTDYYNFPNKKI